MVFAEFWSCITTYLILTFLYLCFRCFFRMSGIRLPHCLPSFPIWYIVFKKLPRSMSLLSSQIDVAVAEALQLEVPPLMWDRGGKCSGKKPSLHSTQLSKEPHWNLASSAPAYRRHVTYNDNLGYIYIYISNDMISYAYFACNLVWSFWLLKPSRD